MTAKELHSYVLNESTFTFVDQVSLSRSQGGKAVAVVEYGDSYLRTRFTTLRLYLHQRHAWEAWKDGLRGGLNSFLAWDASRPEPLAYPNGVPEIKAGTWDGKGTVSAIAANLITAAGAPEGFKVSAGDHLGLVQSGRYGLYRVAADATAGEATIAVPVEPVIPLNIFSSAATVVFWRPQAEFILLSETWSNPVTAEFAPISFEAVQRI